MLTCLFAHALERGWGVVCSNFNPPPPDPPNAFHPRFPILSFLGEGSAPQAPKIYFPFVSAYFFFTLCFYTQNTQNFVENSTMFEKYRRFFDP